MYSTKMKRKPKKNKNQKNRVPEVREEYKQRIEV
jgi:hypothetical protein